MTYAPYQHWEEPRPRRAGVPFWAWMLIAIGSILLLTCISTFGFLAYIGLVGPDTGVYSGNRIPARFTDAMRDVGALEDDEQILYFYSDALIDIRGGFYFVSDRGVVVYGDRFVTPLTRVTFDEVTEATLSRETSFFIDSEIELTLADGTFVYFPLSSDHDGDVRFFEAIRQRIR